MLKLATLECILIVALTFQISTPPQSNLGFSNYTASGVTQNQITSFISYVNTAATLFEADLPKHISYIVSQMNTYVGTPKEKYSVIIQKVLDNSNFFVYSINGSNVASRTSINPKQPGWSYLFYRYNAGTSSFNFECYISYLSKGEGFSQNFATIVNSVISQTQISKSCDCSVASSIGQKLKTVFSVDYALNVVCEVSQNTISQVNSWNLMWIYTKPKNCYFTIWSSPI